MAGVNIPTGFGQCTYNFIASSGRPAACVIGVQIGDVDPQDVADVLSATFADTLLESLPSAVQYTGCRVKIGNDGPPLVAESTQDIGPGGNSGQPAISNTAVLVVKRTIFAGRKYQGRMFLPGPTEGQTDDGANLTNDGLSGWEGTVLAFFNALQDGEVIEALVLLHSGVEVPTEVEQLVVQRRLATQRRRLRK